jgi:Ca2+-dependent lipid-binding protein
LIISAYVKIHGCGNHKLKTKVIQNNLNPEWNEVFHLTLESLEGNLKLILDVYDEDINNDDFIGGLSIDLQQIIAKGSEEGV